LQDLDKTIGLTSAFWQKCIEIVQSNVENEKLDNVWDQLVEVEASTLQHVNANNSVVSGNIKL